MSGRIIGNSLPGKHEFDSRTSLWHWIMDHIHQTYSVRLQRDINLSFRPTFTRDNKSDTAGPNLTSALNIYKSSQVSSWSHSVSSLFLFFGPSRMHTGFCVVLFTHCVFWHLQSVQRNSGVFADVRNAGVAASLTLFSAERSKQTRSSRRLHHDLQEVRFLASNCFKKEHCMADCRIMTSQIVLRIEISISSATLYKHAKS